MLFRPKRWQVILAGIVVSPVLIGGLKWFVFEWAKDYLFGKLTEETEEAMTSAVGEAGWEYALEWVAAGSLGLLIAIILILVGYYFRGAPRATGATASPDTEDIGGDAIDSVLSALAEKDPANTLVILSAGIERIRLQDNHPAWEIFFAAYNGGVGEVRLVSAGGSFRVRGQAYPTSAELKSATPAKHGEIALFTVRQWIEQQDVPQLQQGENHIVLQLSDLRIEAIATDPISGTDHPFVVPLPDHLQFDVRHHWGIHPELFARFYRERLGTDDNGAAQGARKTRTQKISALYAQAVKLRNRAFSLRVLDAATETRINEIQEQLTEQMRDLAPERSINLETINTYSEGDHPHCVLQEPSRTRAMIFSEVLLRVKKILEDYK